MELPDHLFYTTDHEWISSKTGKAKVGVSSYAVEQLGDIVHIELPEEGDIIATGEPFGTIESTKTVSDLYMPVAGKILQVNKEILNSPEKLQEDPYEKGWLIKVEINEPIEEIMSSVEYEAFLEK